MKETICTVAGLIGGFIATLLGGWDSALSTLVIFMGDSPQCGQCHQLKTYDSDGKWNGNEIFYEGKIC